MKSFFGIFVAVMLAGCLLLPLAPAASAATPERNCVLSPTRGWELDRGGKACRTWARRFVRVTRQLMGRRPALSGCSTRRPRYIWRCTATRWRTSNIKRGDIVRGAFQRIGGRWQVVGLRFPKPRY